MMRIQTSFHTPIQGIAARMGEPQDVLDILSYATDTPVRVVDHGDGRYAYDATTHLLLEGARAVAKKTRGSASSQPAIVTPVAGHDTEWMAFFNAWFSVHGVAVVTVADLHPIATRFPVLIGTSRTVHYQRNALGQRIARVVGQPIGGFVVRAAGAHHHTRCYQLVPAGGAA